MQHHYGCTSVIASHTLPVLHVDTYMCYEDIQ
jgi:hypothetical protein